MKQDFQKWIMALLPFERGYMLGYFHAKQEEGRYLSDVSIKDLSLAERKKLVIKAFDVQSPDHWKYNKAKRRYYGDKSK